MRRLACCLEALSQRLQAKLNQRKARLALHRCFAQISIDVNWMLDVIATYEEPEVMTRGELWNGLVVVYPVHRPVRSPRIGAKIVRRDGSSQVNEVILTEPIEGARAELVEPSQLGGTRHLSAARFVRDQHDAMALVASQDGRFTVFA